MNKTTLLLLKILRMELWNEKDMPNCDINSKEYHSLMDLATKQAVTGIVAQSITDKKLNIKLSPEDAVKTLMQFQHIQQLNVLINAELIALAELFNKHNIKFIVFKGQTNAINYPHPLSRIPGDIDFYVPQEDLDKAISILKKEWNANIENNGSLHHLEFTHNRVLFEMHFAVLGFYSSRQKEVFEKIALSRPVSFVEINGHNIPTFEPLINIVYTFAHLWYHLLELGVGLRQMCDLAKLIEIAFPENDGNNEEKAGKLAEIINEIGFYKAFCAIEEVLQNHLGLKYIPIKPKINPIYSQSIMNRIMRYGNFGHFGRKGNRTQLRFYIYLTLERTWTFIKFYPLDKREIKARLFKEIPSKVFSFHKMK